MSTEILTPKFQGIGQADRTRFSLGYTKLLVASVVAALLMAVTTAAGPIPKANAAYTWAFCSGAWLQPYGQNGDRCIMAQGYANHYGLIGVNTKNQAGCVAATGYNGEQVVSWACASFWQQARVYPPNPEGWYRGIIRNNSATAAEYGGWADCWPWYQCV